MSVLRSAWELALDDFDDLREPYYGCALCAHDMANECGPSNEEHACRRICICCVEIMEEA